MSILQEQYEATLRENERLRDQLRIESYNFKRAMLLNDEIRERLDLLESEGKTVCQVEDFITEEEFELGVGLQEMMKAEMANNLAAFIAEKTTPTEITTTHNKLQRMRVFRLRVAVILEKT